MSAINYSNVCRTCLSESINIKSVFTIEQAMDLEMALCDMLMECASVTVIKDDGLPSNICMRCISKLQKAFSFKRMCENSDHTLRNCTDQVTQMISQEDINYEIKDVKPNVNVYEDSTMVMGENHLSDWGEDNVSEPCDDASSIKSNEENFEKNCTEEKIKESNIQENVRRKKSYKCEECRQECLGLAAYWKHMASVHGKNLKCDICSREFKTQNLLKQHKTAHQKSNEVDIKRTRNKTGITKKRNLPRTCDICNKTFRFHSNLERHKLIHTGEKPFLCNVCGKGFGQMSYLKIHSFIHTGEKPYKCQMCDKSFAAPGTLMTHVRIHTGERPHVCKICGKDFPQSGYLSAHIRTHTGEKPIECKVCHRRFNQSGRLVVHMRIHSGEKPYSCKECGRCFAVRGTLKKHIRTHTGERPYVCSVCGQAFAQSGTLATHMKVHRPKQ
ncbi:zinc finger protein OZF-like [Zophobas morio]|uniref:zinc finger protein OZF-like n=1 Tax=Zophobas morio TaxID=2755281 RepID=UPI003083032D